MRKIAWLLVLLTVGSALSGCVSTTEIESEETVETELSETEDPEAEVTETEELKTDVSDAPVTSEDPDTPDDSGTTEVSSEFAYSEEALAAIEGLYVNFWNEDFAASYLGYREEGDNSTLSEWLYDNCPMLVSFWPFLLEIPQEDIIGDHGYLYCVVPMDHSVEYTVKSVEWEYEGNGATPHYSDPIYYPEVDRPFLLYSTCASWLEDPDLTVETVEASGFVGTWFPVLNADGVISNPLAWEGGYTIVDFANLYDIGDYVPHLYNGTAGDSGWLAPTEQGLANTSWYSVNGWVLSFGEDGNAEDGLVLYCPEEGEEGTLLTPYYESTWWIEDDRLCLGYYDGNCPFPLLISPSGEQLVIMKADDGSVLPFFVEGQTICTMSLVDG